MLLATEIMEEMRKGNIKITPEARINPNSVNLTLNKYLQIYSLDRSHLLSYDTIMKNREAASIGDFNRAKALRVQNEIEFNPWVEATMTAALQHMYPDKLKKSIITEKLSDYYNPETQYLRDRIIYGPSCLDMLAENNTVDLLIPDEGLVLYPGILYIGSTNEFTEIKGCVPTINGRSSTGRLGLSVHITAGFGDHGFRGTWTLEITVEEPLRVYPDQEVCQISFEEVKGDINDPLNNYSGRYYNQEGPTKSRMYLGDKYKEIKENEKDEEKGI